MIIGDSERIVSVVALPDQDFVDVLAFFFGGVYGDIGAGFVIDPFAITVVAVSIDQDAAAGIGGTEATGFTAESAENDGVDDAQAGAGEHGDGQLRNHGHVDGDAVASFQSGEIAQQGGGFVYAAVEFLVGDDSGGFVFGLGNEDQGGFVFVLREMAVDAVVAGVEFAAYEPFPEGWIGGVQRGVPVVVPVEQFGVFVEAFGEVLFVEAGDEVGVVKVGLADELGRWVEEGILLSSGRRFGLRFPGGKRLGAAGKRRDWFAAWVLSFALVFCFGIWPRWDSVWISGINLAVKMMLLRDGWRQSA